MTELQWHFSVPLDQRARRQFQRWIVGRVGKGSRSSGCLVMVVLLLFAPRSLGGFRSRLPLRLLLWSRLRVVRQVRLPVRSGRDTRGLGCAAAAVVVMARGVAGGSLSFSPRLGLAAGAGSVWVLPRFFSRSVRTQDARGRSSRSSGGWTGVVRRNGATKTRGVYYCCILRGGDLDFSQPSGRRRWSERASARRAAAARSAGAAPRAACGA